MNYLMGDFAEKLSPAMAKGRWLARNFWGRRADFLTPAFWSKSARIAGRLATASLWPKSILEDELRVFAKRPFNLHIEPTNACNVDCVFCAYQYMERPKKVMPMDLYLKALDDYCAMGGGDLLLEVVVGDPTLDPTFLEKVATARARKEIRDIATITNGIGLDRVGVDKLIEAGLTHVTISTSGFDRESYHQIYRSKQYDKMRGNVLDLLRSNERAGRPVEVTIGFRTNRTVNQVLTDPDFQELKKYDPQIDFTFSFSDWVGRIDFDELPKGFVKREQPPQTETCTWLYDGPIVFATGEVGLCGCQDVEAKSELVVGNIKEQSLYEIWNSPKVAELRQRFMTPRKPDVCQNCTSYRNLDHLRSLDGLRRTRVTAHRLRNSRCSVPPGPSGKVRHHLPVL